MLTGFLQTGERRLDVWVNHASPVSPTPRHPFVFTLSDF
jgi:hypothetical protein